MGGSVLEGLPQSFYKDVIHLFKCGVVVPVIVHGGGPMISSLLTKLDIQTEFVEGQRVTTDEVLDVVEMVLSGTVNKQLVCKLNGFAYGISGVDGMLLQAAPSLQANKLGFVGEVVEVKKEIIKSIVNQGYIPVISPLGIDEYGQRFNINGDVAASAVAKSLGASLCMISDIPGIYKEENGEKIILQELSKEEITKMVEEGFITGGMIPKVNAAVDGLVHDVPEVVIINGKQKHSLLDYAAGKKIGTKIVLRKEQEHVY